MTGEKYFPAVRVIREQQGLYAARSAIRVESLLSPLLREADEREESQWWRENFRNHVALLKALTGWPDSARVSLNIFTRPDCSHPQGGRIETALVIEARGTDEQRLVAELLGRHSAVLSLLRNFLPEAEFAVVTDEAALAVILEPFRPAQVMAIRRRQAFFTVSRLRDGEQAPQMGMGFLAGDRLAPPADAQATTLPYTFPWSQPDPLQGDLAALAEALLANPSPLWFQVRLRPARADRDVIAEKQKTLSRCEDLLADFPATSTLRTVQLKAMRDALTERLQELGSNLFAGGAFLCSTAPIDEAVTSAVAAVIAPELSSPGESAISLFGGYQVRSVSVRDFLDPEAALEQEPFTPLEAASMFRVPYPQQRDVSGFPIREFRTRFVAPGHVQKYRATDLLLGDNVHRGLSNVIRMTPDERMRHCCIFGQTGTGKSTLLANMVVQDIENGLGLCLIDPHGDLVTEVLNRFPEKRKDDLVLVDMLDPDQVLPMNLLAWNTPDERDFLIDDLYTWLDKTYDMRQTGGPMFELYFRTFLRVVMGDEPRKEFTPTIADFMRMFTDSEFRRFCGQSIRDDQVRFMMEQANKAGGDARLENIAPYITSKLNRFTLDQNMKRMINQEKMVIDFSSVMDQGRVMLVNLGRGRYGEVASGLIASQLVARFKAAAMRRVNIPVDKRRDFYLYVDEFQNIASEDFVTMLSEARKFRLGLILANQYAEQLDSGLHSAKGSVLQAILGNVGTMINFRLGIRDAEVLEPVFFPEFNRFDLVSLPLGHCCINMKTGGNRSLCFSLRTRYRHRAADPDKMARLRAVSNKKYAITVDEANRNLSGHLDRIQELLQTEDDDLDRLESMIAGLGE